MSHTGEPRATVPIAPGSLEKTQARRFDFGQPSPYRSVEVPARVRTSHACNRCRELRAKCSGGVRCAKCTKDDNTCLYSDRKRERNKKNLARSARQIDDLQNDRNLLLSTLKSLIDNPEFDKEKFPDVLASFEKLSEDQAETPQSSSYSASQEPGRSISRGQLTEGSPMDTGRDALHSSAGESLARSDVGSPDRLRELASAVDLKDGDGMPGYVGKMSDVSWLQKIREHLSGSQPLGEPELKASDIDIHSLDAPSLSYFTDDVNLLGIDEDYLDPHVIPDWHVAQVLTEAYFHSIQGCFRFVERTEFFRNLKRIYDKIDGRIAPDWPQRRTLALANVMWAVGARWIELAGLKRRTVPDHGRGLIVEDQLVYYARARSLGLDHRMQLEHPSLEMIQGMAILGFYLLSNGSVHRSWNIVAQTIRHATALGLHLKILPGVFSAAELRRRARVWWSLFRMEIMLSEITGRPKCVKEMDITAPFRSLFLGEDEVDADTPVTTQLPDAEYSSLELWQSFLGDSSQIGEKFVGGLIPWSSLAPIGSNISESHFAAALELSGLSYKVGSTLYLSPADLTWADVQETVRELESDLGRWEQSLPPDLMTDHIGKTEFDPRSNLDLELSLCSVRMILYRPFVCEIRIEDESTESAKFNQSSARAGVIAAIRMTELIPDDPVAEQVLLMLPWWSLLHLISQAAAMLCLELCLNAQHMQNETADVMVSLRKALNYLWALAPTSKSAYRAWHIYRPLVAKVAQKYRRSALTEIPVIAATPEAWSEQDEQMLRGAIPRFSS